jgi:hypothetical protein
MTVPPVPPKNPYDWINNKLKPALRKMGDDENEVRNTSLKTVMRLLNEHASTHTGCTLAEVLAMPGAPTGKADGPWGIMRGHLAGIRHTDENKRKKAMIASLEYLKVANLELPAQGNNAPVPIRKWLDLSELFVMPVPIASTMPSASTRVYNGPPFTTESLEAAIEDMFRQYCLYECDEDYTMVALWVMHCGVWREFAWTTRFAFAGVRKEGGEGKTRGLEVTGTILAGHDFWDIDERPNDKVAMPGSITDSSFVSELDARKVMLLDEYDNKEITKAHLTLYNDGCRRGAYRQLNLKGEQVRLRIDGPWMTGGVGKMPQQALRRTHILDTDRKSRAQLDAAGVRRYRITDCRAQLASLKAEGRVDEANQLAADIANYQLVHEMFWAWVDDNRGKLTMDPVIPDGLNPSAEEAWQALLSISQRPDAGTLTGRARVAAIKKANRETTSWRERLSHTAQDVFDQAMADLESLVTPHPYNGWIEPTPFNPERNFQLWNDSFYDQVFAISGDIYLGFTGERGNEKPHKMSKVEMGSLIGCRSETIWPHRRRPDSRSVNGRTWRGLQSFFAAFPRRPSTPPTAPEFTGLTPPAPEAPVPPAPGPAAPTTPTTPPKSRGQGRPKGKRKPGNGAAAHQRTSRKGGKSEAIRALLTRPEGCTNGDLLEATCWPAISVQAVARRLGLTLRQEKQGRITRYWGQDA